MRKLREYGKPTAEQVKELLAEDIVFNSPILVRPIEGRDVCGRFGPHFLEFERPRLQRAQSSS